MLNASFKSTHYSKTTNGKIKIFITCFFLIHILGGIYVYTNNAGKKLIVYKNSPIDASIYLSPSLIESTQDITDEESIHKSALTVTVNNNTVATLTKVLLIFPPIGIGTLESVSANRVTNLPQQGADAVFSLGNIPSGRSKKATVWLYSRERKIYTIKVWIDTNEKFTATTNVVTLEVK